MEYGNFDKTLSLSLLYKMILIRTFEDTISCLKNQNQVYGMAHCYNGQEAIAVGACSALNKTDYIISNHRPHGHAIAKGVDLNQIMSEIFGKSTGTNAGKGGSMHINSLEHGLITASGIVGSGIPVACGSAYSSKFKQDKKVTCVFFGDGAANEGTFFESLNLAAIWKLPIVFVLEDNGLAITTLTKNTSACSDYTALASAFGINSALVDGQNVEAVYNAVSNAVQTARNDSMPTLIQAKTIRFNEHAEGEWYLRMREANYRNIQELEQAKIDSCPIEIYSNVLQARKILSKIDVEKLYEKAYSIVQKSVEFALKSPYPDPQTAFENVYMGGV